MSDHADITYKGSWSLAQNKKTGDIYLYYDFNREAKRLCRGVWEKIGSKHTKRTAECVRKNKENGYLVCEDINGDMRVLVCVD